jgi:hypothetical protein
MLRTCRSQDDVSRGGLELYASHRQIPDSQEPKPTGWRAGDLMPKLSFRDVILKTNSVAPKGQVREGRGTAKPSKHVQAWKQEAVREGRANCIQPPQARALSGRAAVEGSTKCSTTSIGLLDETVVAHP